MLALERKIDCSFHCCFFFYQFIFFPGCFMLDTYSVVWLMSFNGKLRFFFFISPSGVILTTTFQLNQKCCRRRTNATISPTTTMIKEGRNRWKSRTDSKISNREKYRRLAKCNRRCESRSHRMINYGKYYNAKEDKDYINNSRKPFSVH